MTDKNNIPLLLYAASDSDADMLYFSGIFIPDPFIAFEHKKRSFALFNKLEFSRAKKESQVDEVLLLEDYLAKARQASRKEKVNIVDVICLIAKELNTKAFHVPFNFPTGIAYELKKHKIDIIPNPDLFASKRLRKTDKEIEYIKEGNKASAAGILKVESILKEAEIRVKNRLYWKNKPLTSEILRIEIEKTCIERGAIASHTIAAGGIQACDPHCIGSGQLFANELIIIDIFPRVSKTGYHGDMTRTFLKGSPSEAQKKLVNTVKKAQKLGLSKIKNQIKSKTVHKSITDLFDKEGFKTELKNGTHQGFIHGTGHGLGLDIHEAPRVSNCDDILKTNMVVTVEPGLYYPEIGGARIEDVVKVEKNGYSLLSKCHYMWHIK